MLGSILGALKSIVNVIGMTKMTPPIKDLLPRLTPILKNRHEKARTPCLPVHACCAQGCWCSPSIFALLAGCATSTERHLAALSQRAVLQGHTMQHDKAAG